MNCPICLGSQVTLIFELEDAFVSVAQLPKKPNMRSLSGELKIVQCQKCNFVFNSAFDLEKMNDCYTHDEYVVKTPASPEMSKNLQSVYGFLEPHLSAGRSLEVAPGNGALAFQLSKKMQQVVTVDPSPSSRQIITALDSDNLTHIQGFFESALASAIPHPFDLCVARHLIEHLSQPIEFLRQLHNCLGEKGLLYLELPDFSEIHQSSRYYDLFHDHFGYFNKTILTSACLSVGFELIDSFSLFKNQHMGLLFKKAKPLDTLSFIELQETASNFTVARDYLNQLVSNASGICAVWGAGAHANAWINNLTPGLRAKIALAFDKDPSKIGRYLQGATTRVLMPTKEALSSIDHLFIVASLYEEEIEEEVRTLNYSGKLYPTNRLLQSFL